MKVSNFFANIALCCTLGFLIFFFQLPVEASCSYGTEQYVRNHGLRFPTFGYGKKNGPLEWLKLNKTENEACARGRNQSPVNIFLGFPTEIGFGLQFRIDPYPNGTWIQNIGTTIVVPANGTMTIFRTHYRLVQFHFHMPSEHRILGEHHAMEWHFVFEGLKDKDRDKLAIVAFMVGIGKPDSTLASIFSNIHNIKRVGQTALTGPLHWRWVHAFIDERATHNYQGSLTTPPCTENVDWFVVEDLLYIDDVTFEKVKSVIKWNARPTQNALGDANLLEKSALEMIREL